MSNGCFSCDLLQSAYCYQRWPYKQRLIKPLDWTEQNNLLDLPRF